jgi:hypothetical protein
MAIIATNRIKTAAGVEIIVNFHRERGMKDAVTFTVNSPGVATFINMTAQEACDLQNALDRTNREFDEADIIPEETAKDRYIDNVGRPDHL